MSSCGMRDCGIYNTSTDDGLEPDELSRVTPRSYVLWRDEKQESVVCLYVQRSLDCCGCFSMRVDVQLCVSEGRMTSRSAPRQCNPKAGLCVCVCVNGLCSHRNSLNTYRWSILSRKHKQVCVLPVVRASCISSETAESACEVWSGQTGVREGIRSAMKERKQTK